MFVLKLSGIQKSLYRDVIFLMQNVNNIKDKYLSFKLL